MSKNKQIDILSQNPDTPIKPIFHADDTRPYEQKNMPKGAFKKHSSSK